MSQKIRIVSGDVWDTASVADTVTARKVLEALPVSSKARIWGREVYFPIPVEDVERDAQALAPPGTLAYWPPGHCFCIFFGQTPASPVNVVGKLDGDPDAWEAVSEGDEVRIELASDADSA